MEPNVKKSGLKHWLYHTMDVPAVEDDQGFWYEIFMMVLIVLNAVAMILGTVESIQAEYGWFLNPFETVSVLIFSVEYVLLLWVCTDNEEYRDPVRGRIAYAMTPMALINLASVLPAFIPFIIPLDLRALRLFRLFRLVRVFKLTKYSSSMKVIFRAIDSRKEQLILTLCTVVLLVVITSIFIYYAETGENPSPSFSDLPHTIWWGLETLSPIAVESSVPITFTGKLIATIYALLQIAIFAVPAGIMCSAFDDAWKNRNDPEWGNE